VDVFFKATEPPPDPDAWVFDAPSGTYRNPRLADRLREKARKLSVFFSLVRWIVAPPGARCQTVCRIDVETSQLVELHEGQRLPETEVKVTTVDVKLREYGTAVPFTSLNEDLDPKSPGPVQSALVGLLTRTYNAMIGGALKSTPLKYVPLVRLHSLTPLGVGPDWHLGTDLTKPRFKGLLARLPFFRDRRRPIIATRNLIAEDIELLADYLTTTYHTPLIEGVYLVMVAQARAFTHVRQDRARFIPLAAYAQYREPMLGEIGKVGQVRLIATNENVLPMVGKSGCLGEAVIFGEEAVAAVEALEPELRCAVPANYGRDKAVAWYAIMAAKLLYDTRAIHVTSAPVPPTLRERAAALGRRIKAAPRIAYATGMHKARYGLAILVAGGHSSIHSSIHGSNVHKGTFGYDEDDCSTCRRAG